MGISFILAEICNGYCDVDFTTEGAILPSQNWFALSQSRHFSGFSAGELSQLVGDTDIEFSSGTRGLNFDFRDVAVQFATNVIELVTRYVSPTSQSGASFGNSAICKELLKMVT